MMKETGRMIENQGERDQKIVTIFDDIYNLPDCSTYYRAMDHAGFRTAHHAAAAFRAVLSELKRARGLSTAGIVDFASGYGIGGALTRHDLTLADVLLRYRDDWFDDATPDAVIAADRDWYASHRRAGQDDQYYGIDIADKALGYARAVGIFDEVFAENLQAEDASAGLQRALASTDLVIECGSVAHMLPAALDRVLQGAQARMPWVITAPIRGNDTAEAIEVMGDHGLTVEELDVPPFRHRRFADEAEQARAVANAEARGHDAEGFETTGYFHAQLFLARPASEVTPVSGWPVSPIADLSA
ncbi:hypothetical protein [uncultured Roseovarius sp.]|uniref:hypothetical protein n=1 Tax=uncultured Roseovarius sp. TaxID=293344 RepID=UPI002607E14B|nr:hypothetical protein [uncultured Roseovarius sp.]